MQEKLKQARKDRLQYGNVFLLLQLLKPFVDDRSIIAELPFTTTLGMTVLADGPHIFVTPAGQPACLIV